MKAGCAMPLADAYESVIGGAECVWVAMKGKRPDAEISALPSDVEVFHVEQLKVPGLDAERCLVWMRRASTMGAQQQ